MGDDWDGRRAATHCPQCGASLYAVQPHPHLTGMAHAYCAGCGSFFLLYVEELLPVAGLSEYIGLHSSTEEEPDEAVDCDVGGLLHFL